MNLRTLSDSEFLRYASSQIDDLTSSDIERELLRRLELVDTDTFEAVQESELCAADLQQLAGVLETYTVQEVVEFLDVVTSKEHSAKTVTEFLTLLDKAGITEPDELTAELELAGTFKKLANDAGDIFTRLHTLTEETQED